MKALQINFKKTSVTLKSLNSASLFNICSLKNYMMRQVSWGDSLNLSKKSIISDWRSMLFLKIDDIASKMCATA